MKKVTIYTDGGARGNPGPAAIGVYAVSGQTDEIICEFGKTIGNATNNMAEYLAVVHGLRALKEKFGKKTKTMEFELKIDSELVKKQLTAEYQIKDTGLIPYFIEIHNLRVSNFPNLTIVHIPRNQNKEADRLVNEALDGKL